MRFFLMPISKMRYAQVKAGYLDDIIESMTIKIAIARTTGINFTSLLAALHARGFEEFIPVVLPFF